MEFLLLLGVYVLLSIATGLAVGAAALSYRFFRAAVENRHVYRLMFAVLGLGLGFVAAAGCYGIYELALLVK